MANNAMKLQSPLLLPLLLCATSAVAQPFATLDARSMAMGDTGVASAQPGTAALFNPALLSYNSDGETIHIILPNLGVSVFADPDALDAYNEIEDEAYIDNIDIAIQGMENPDNQADFIRNKEQFTNNSRSLSSNLNELSEQPFRINAAGFASVAIPTKALGLAVFANVNATIETTPIVTDCDTELLNDYVDFFESVQTEAELYIAASTNPTAGCNDTPIAVQSGASVIITDPSDDLTSEVIVAGVTISELGIAIAHDFRLFGKDVSLGITPKLQTITSYYATPSVQQLDDDNYDLADELEDSENDDSDVNLDIGLATSFLSDSLTVGLTIKNIIANQYETSVSPRTGRAVTFDVDTQARLGVAWDAPAGLTFAADLDLTKNKPFFLGEDTQFLGVGVEWDVASMIRLRGGLRSNLADADDQAITAGLGFNIIAVYFDLGAQFSENNAGGALQVGVQF